MTTTAITYETREAQCDNCGAAFTSRKYSNGWTRFCSKRCSGMARYNTSASGAKASATPAETLTPEPEPQPQPAPQVDLDETLIERKRAWAETQPAPESVQIPTMFAPRVASASQPTVSVRVGITDAGSGDTHTTDTWPLLSALLGRLPTSGEWTPAARERWLRAFTATLDLEIVTTTDATERVEA